MKAIQLFLIISYGSVLALENLLKENCFMSTFYRELQCDVIAREIPQIQDSCPFEYKCRDVHQDPTKCYYRGKAYSDRENIPQSEVIDVCSQACRCTVRGTPKIECASVDCPEAFDQDIDRDCIKTYQLDSCCSTGKVCGKDAIARLTTCQVDGKEFYQGQYIDLYSKGESCICGPTWETSRNTSCKNVSCGLELHYQDALTKKCAPIFYGNETCPIGFKCPSGITKTIPPATVNKNFPQVNKQGPCQFGNTTLQVGEGIATDDKCLLCSCEIPPYVSCKQVENC